VPVLAILQKCRPTWNSRLSRHDGTHRGCINPKHLAWKTASEATHESYRSGRLVGYGRNGKLISAEVAEIRALGGSKTATEIGKIYGISAFEIGGPLVSPGSAGSWDRRQIFASWLESLVRLGGFIIRISLPRLRVLMLSNPLERVMLRNKAPDYFRFAVGPQNIDPPARSGIFPSHESWSLLEHPSNMRPRRPGSSQPSCHNQTDHQNLKGRSAPARPRPRQAARDIEARDRSPAHSRAGCRCANYFF
jgi:hypothetical protein